VVEHPFSKGKALVVRIRASAFERSTWEISSNGTFIKIHVISVTRYNDKIFKSFRVLYSVLQ
jgi:hypothetical protein